VETEDQKAEISWIDQEPKISDHNQEADKVNQSDQEVESSNSDNQSDQDETQSLNSPSSSDRVADLVLPITIRFVIIFRFIVIRRVIRVRPRISG